MAFVDELKKMAKDQEDKVKKQMPTVKNLVKAKCRQAVKEGKTSANIHAKDWLKAIQTSTQTDVAQILKELRKDPFFKGVSFRLGQNKCHLVITWW